MQGSLCQKDVKRGVVTLEQARLVDTPLLQTILDASREGSDGNIESVKKHVNFGMTIGKCLEHTNVERSSGSVCNVEVEDIAAVLRSSNNKIYRYID